MMKIYDLLFEDDLKRTFRLYSGSTGGDQPDHARSQEQFKADKDFKKQWNKLADHNFFNNDLVKIHYVGGFAGASCRSKSPADCMYDILMKWNAGKVNKNEISTVGYLPPLFPIKNHILSNLALKLDGYVSYAGSKDSQTEWTSWASELDKQNHQSSGLQKRAAVSLAPELAKQIMLNKEDFISKSSSEEYNEIILDNFKISGVVIDLETNYFEPSKRTNLLVARGQELKKIKEWCQKNGLSFHTMDGQDLMAVTELKNRLADVISLA
jgi:hypothetical protein